MNAGKSLFEDSHTDEQIKLMLCNEEPLPFELDRGWWDCIQPPAVAGLLRNLLQRKPVLRMTVDDVLRVRESLASFFRTTSRCLRLSLPQVADRVTLVASQVIQTLATASPAEDRRLTPRDGDSEAGTSRVESATEVGGQLSQWPTTWSMNFSDRPAVDVWWR